MSNKPVNIELTSGEGAIVFGEDGVKIYAASPMSKMPLAVRETIEFVTYALLKPDWIHEFHEYIATAEAIMDLMGKEKTAPPELRLIQGGKSDPGPREDDES